MPTLEFIAEIKLLKEKNEKQQAEIDELKEAIAEYDEVVDEQQAEIDERNSYIDKIINKKVGWLSHEDLLEGKALLAKHIGE